MKRRTCLVIALILLTTMLPVSVAAATETASGICGDDLTWVLDSDGILTISGSGAMADYASCSNSPFYQRRSSIKTVVLESGVTSIGSNAFYNCSGLESVTIPDGVTSIGSNAFYGCKGLTDVYFKGSKEWNV